MAFQDEVEFLRRLGIEKLAEVLTSFRQLAKKQVLVGIPASNGFRPDYPITNAQIGYINEVGDPATNLPPRPFLLPGVQAVQPETIQSMKRAAIYALSAHMQAAEITLHKMGLRAQVSVRARITDGPFAPLAPRTISERKRKNKSAPPFRPLIETGTLRQSITYVIRTRK